MEGNEPSGLPDEAERIVSLVDSGNGQGAISVWASLSQREQRVVAIEMATLIAQLRKGQSGLGY
jgi:precorrin-6B methylase 2